MGKNKKKDKIKFKTRKPKMSEIVNREKQDYLRLL